jgi:RNA polymerase sigma-54 factor
MLTQKQQQKHQLKISANKIQLLNFYALTSLDLECQIKNELAENPFLECKDESDNDDDRDQHTAGDVQDFQDWDEYGYDDVSNHTADYQNYFGGDQLPEKPLVYHSNFKEEARQQLSLLQISERQQDIAEYIIDVLNDRGQLDRDLEDIAEEISFKVKKMIELEEVEAALQVVHTLDPIGLGTRNIRECLMLQLCQMNQDCKEVQIALSLVKDHYNELLNRQFERITNALKIDADHLKRILVLISKLKFYPVSGSESIYEPKNIIIPDLIVSYNADTIHVGLRRSRASSLHIAPPSYDMSITNKAAGQYIRNKLQSAEWLIDAIKQREEKMLSIMKCIVSLQFEYFKEGDIMKLKPMVLRNIAEMTGYDISTVSRITTEKYAETHFGFVYLKDLFSEGITDHEGNVISNKVIQSIIEDTISQEDKSQPYTDQQLLCILYGKGYNIARRTVTKYRELMNIPIAQIRAVLV